MIGALTGCDMYRIEAAEPYSDDYDQTVARNVREQETDADRETRRAPAVNRAVRQTAPLAYSALGMYARR